MEAKKKEIDVFIANDGTEFSTVKACLDHEFFLKVQSMHKNLVEMSFYERFKIVPYFHNVDIKNIKPRGDLHKGKYIQYPLMYGRMGNGDCRIRFKQRGNSILLLRYNTSDRDCDQKYVGKIPLSWLDMSNNDLSIEVEKYISNRKVFVRDVVTHSTTITYKEI